MKALLVLLLPFAGTGLGSMMVFFMRERMNRKLQILLLGFAAGVMCAASVWSLLLPSLEMSSVRNTCSFAPALFGFLGGMVFLMIVSRLGEFLSLETKHMKKESVVSQKAMLLFAVVLHNIPEGMAVGIAYGAALAEKNTISLAGAIALSLGIALQNIPEGAIISMPLKAEGMGKGKAFLCGLLSGVVEPVSGFITILLTAMVLPLLPYILAFAAGAMIYVVIEELIPEYQGETKSDMGNIGFALGFALMMVMDVALR